MGGHLGSGQRRPREVQDRPLGRGAALSTRPRFLVRPRSTARQPVALGSTGTLIPHSNCPVGAPPMKNSYRPLLAAIAAFGLVAAAHAEPATFALDPSHTFVTFEIGHFNTSTNRGRFDKKEGNVVL